MDNIAPFSVDADQTNPRNSLTRNIGRGLEEVCEALSRTGIGVDRALSQAAIIEAQARWAFRIRRHRGAIVLTTVVASFWLCVAGVVSAATRQPFSEQILPMDHEPPFVAAEALPGPIEWPTIALAARQLPPHGKPKGALGVKKKR